MVSNSKSFTSPECQKSCSTTKTVPYNRGPGGNLLGFLVSVKLRERTENGASYVTNYIGRFVLYLPTSSFRPV